MKTVGMSLVVLASDVRRTIDLMWTCYVCSMK